MGSKGLALASGHPRATLPSSLSSYQLSPFSGLSPPKHRARGAGRSGGGGAAPLGSRRGLHNPHCFSSLFPASSFAETYLILESPFPAHCLASYHPAPQQFQGFLASGPGGQASVEPLRALPLVVPCPVSLREHTLTAPTPGPRQAGSWGCPAQVFRARGHSGRVSSSLSSGMQPDKLIHLYIPKSSSTQSVPANQTPEIPGPRDPAPHSVRSEPAAQKRFRRRLVALGWHCARPLLGAGCRGPGRGTVQARGTGARGSLGK